MCVDVREEKEDDLEKQRERKRILINSYQNIEKVESPMDGMMEMIIIQGS